MRASCAFTGIDLDTHGVYSVRDDCRIATLSAKTSGRTRLRDEVLDEFMTQASGIAGFVAGRRGVISCMRFIVPLVLGRLLSGCTTAPIEELREAPTQISSDEAIVLLAKPHLEGTG